MRKTFTRIMASLLLVCMLASFVVPATFAGTDDEPTVLSYSFDDFGLVKDAAGKSAFKSGKDLVFNQNSFHTCGKEAKACLKECFYDAGIINWAIDDYSDGANVLFRGDHRSDKSLRLNTEGTWVSIRLNVPQAGKYSIDLRANDSRSAQTWMFPASNLTGGKTAQDFMTADYQLNDTAFQNVSGSLIATLGEDVSLTQGEHIIVFKIKVGASRFYINEITLSKTDEYTEEPDTTSGTTESGTTAPDTNSPVQIWDLAVYDILTDIVPEGSKKTPMDACSCGLSHTIKEHLDSTYTQLGWKFAGTSKEDMSVVSIRAQDDLGLRIVPETMGWVALNLQVAQTGVYDVYVSGKGNQQDGIYGYIFEGALTPDQIAEKMADVNAVSGNKLGSSQITPTVDPTVIGSWDFTAGDYTLVFYNARTKDRTLHIRTVGLLHTETDSSEPVETTAPADTTAPDETTEPADTTVATEPTPAAGNYWDFTICDKTGYESWVPVDNRELSKNCRCGQGHTVKEHLDSCYADLGWKIAATSKEDFSTVTIRGKADNSLQFEPEAQGGWAALTLNVGENGLRDIYVTSYRTSQNSVRVYLFAGALTGEQIAEKMANVNAASANLICTEVKTATTPVTIGAYDFTAGEYTLVLYNTHSSSSRSIYMNGIGLKEYTGDPEGPTVPSVPAVPSTPTVTVDPFDAAAGDIWNFRFYKIPGFENVADLTTYETITVGCHCGKNHKIKDHLDEAYEELGWKIAGTSTETLSGISIRCAENRGLAFKIEHENWAAVTLNVPKSGKYDVTAMGNSTQSGMIAYIFDGALTQEEIAQKMADRSAVAGNLLSVSVIPGTERKTVGAWDFNAGEYTVVFYNTNTKMRTMYLGAMGLTEYSGGVAPTLPGDTDCAGTYTDNFFNFALVTEEERHPMFHNGSGLSNRDFTSKCYACGEIIKDCLAKHWKDGTINWVMEGTSFAEVRIQSTGGVRFRYDTDENGAKIPAVDKDGKDTFRESVGNWVAYRVKVATPGTFTVNVAKSYAYGWVGELYIMPAPVAAMSASELTAAMTEQNKVGPVEFTATMKSSKVGDYAFDAAGEYMIMIKATGTKRMYLDSISLTVPQEAQPIPAVDEKIYDFNLSKDDETLIKKAPTSRYNADGSIRTNEHIESLYNNGTIQWKFETQSAQWQASTASFRAGCFRFKSTENYRDVEDQWFAFRIKSPGTAKYDIRLTTSQAGMYVANIYLIPVSSPMTLSAAKVKAEMTEENMLVKGAIFDKKDTFYLGEYTFGMDEEYVLVFESVKGTQFFLNEIKMTKDGLVANGTVKKEKPISGYVYDFDMGDSLNGYFPDSKTYMADVKGELDAMWRNGTLKWRWETSSSGAAPGNLHRFYRVGGMRFFHKENAWVAVRIKSPGSGTYTLTMNHAIMTSGGTTAVYILPGDTEDIEFAMDPKNRVGKVAMYNDGINPNVEDGKTSFVGYWDFEAGKEYIMVFESYKASPYSDNSYANISQVIAQKGKIDYTTTEDKKVDSVMVQENVVQVADALSTCVVTEIYGHDYFFLPIEGGAMLVYDLDTGELVDTVNTGYSRAIDTRQDQDGNIWISGMGKYIVRYNPYTQETFRTPMFTSIDWMAGYSGANSICPTPDGKLWFGTYYSSILAVYDPETNEYRKVGKVADQNISKIHSIIYHNDFLYMTTEAGDGETTVVKFDLKTEQVVGSVDTSHLMDTAKYLATLSMLGDGDLLVAGVNSNKLAGFVAVDPETMELVEVEGIFGYMGMYASEVVDGKQYVVSNGYGLYEYDLATKTFSKTPGFGNQGIGFRSTANSLVTIDGQKCLFTYTTSGGHPRYFALESVEYKTWDDLVVHGAGGADIRNVTAGPDDGRLYIGVFNSDQCGIYDVNQGKLTGYYKTGGQGDSQIWYEGKFYGGNYSSTTLNEIVITDYNAPRPATNEVIQRWRLDHEETKQKRVHELAAGDGYIFAGTIPDTGYYGGAVTVYDTRTGRWYTHRNVVQDCAVTGLEHHDKLLYGVTSTSGGTGTTEAKPAGVSAKIFVYDYENRKVVATMDPRDYISGLPSTIAFIGGFGQDPVVEGRFWAVVSETMFCFTYDTQAKTFQVQEVISFDKSTCDASAAKHMWSKRVLFDTERNYIYYSFDANGGFQRMELADWNAPIGSVKVKAHERIMGDAPQFYEIGADGELYYGKDANLMMLPLNVTDEDWAISGAVDQMIVDLGEITLEKEADIKSARSAYDNLSWRYKALTQKLELLQESETDLLECKIDTVILEEVTADSLPQLQEYVDTYNGFNARQQKYTKNYNHLMEAYAKATKLNDERVAAAMQARMEALKEKFPLTLEDEPEVLALRADYDALTGPQRTLVDATALEDAEAQIKVLRAEFVKYVETLIQAIPDEITLDAEPAIVAAREAADKLYTNERKEVSYSKLTSAEGKLRSLKNAKAAAEEVDALIKEIGIVTLGDKDRIAAAREAYDALNGTALSFLVGGKKLERAEWILKALQTWMIPAIVVVDAGIVFAVIWFVPSLHSKVFKTKKKEEAESIDN